MLENVYCYAEEASAIGTEAFDDAQIRHILLHVPASSIDSYRSLTPWNRFMDILAFDPYAQCATPSISFVNGILTFDCETEDVEYVTEVRASGRGYFSSNGIRLASLSNQYEVSVRATMPGYIDSEEVTATFTLTPTDLNGDGTLGASDVTLLIDAILNGKD